MTQNFNGQLIFLTTSLGNYQQMGTAHHNGNLWNLLGPRPIDRVILNIHVSTKSYENRLKVTENTEGAQSAPNLISPQSTPPPKKNNLTGFPYSCIERRQRLGHVPDIIMDTLNLCPSQTLRTEFNMFLLAVYVGCQRWPIHIYIGLCIELDAPCSLLRYWLDDGATYGPLTQLTLIFHN